MIYGRVCMCVSDEAPRWTEVVMRVWKLWEAGLVFACIRCSSDWWMTLWLTGTARRGRGSDAGVITASSPNQLCLSHLSLPSSPLILIQPPLCPFVWISFHLNFSALTVCCCQTAWTLGEGKTNQLCKRELAGNHVVKYFIYFHKLEKLQTALW